MGITNYTYQHIETLFTDAIVTCASGIDCTLNYFCTITKHLTGYRKRFALSLFDGIKLLICS